MAATDVTMRSKSETRSVTSPTGSVNGVGPPLRQSSDLSYMHRPPTIVPNYGKKYKGGLKLKTNVPRVLLYDNVTQQTMLDVQLSGIQSQRYKTGRELEMHMKSFLVRKQRKDKALMKLTKVDHGDDYSEFERQYRRMSLDDISLEKDEEEHTRLSLPSIHSTNGVGMSMQTFRSRRRGKKRRRNPRSKSLNGYMNNWHSHNSFHHSAEPYVTHDTGLPHLEGSAQDSSLANGQYLTSPTLNFEPKRRVGFRFERDSSGVTRIFHAISDVDNEATGNGQMQPEENSEINAIHSANQPTDIADGTVIDVSNHEQLEVVKVNNDLPESVFPVSDYMTSGKKKLPKVYKPVHDERFASLHRLLVKQDPPNDGFIELSPSFVRHYPLHQMGEKLSYLRKTAKKAEEDKEDKQSLSSDDTVSIISDGNGSESEEERVDNRGNSALMRLGAQ